MILQFTIRERETKANGRKMEKSCLKIHRAAKEFILLNSCVLLFIEFYFSRGFLLNDEP